MTESFRTRTARLLRTQDNRITAHPVFCVQQRRRTYGFGRDYSDNIVWIDEDADYAEFEGGEEFERLEAHWEEHRSEPDNYRRTFFKDTWVFVTACFTERAAQAYIDVNGHNLTEPRIYVESAYRNREWITVIKILSRDPGRLFDAIRRFTFDAPGDEPNGPTERAMLDLDKALSFEDLEAARDAFRKMMDASSVDCMLLRRAAEKQFPDEDFKGAPNRTLRRDVELGDELFHFDSQQQWVNKGRSWYATCGFREHELVTLDAVGRVVRIGAQFSRAEKEGTYPITVYPIDAAAEPDEGLVVAGTNREIKARAHEATFGAIIEGE